MSKKTHCLDGRWNKELKHPPHLTKTAKLIYTATLLHPACTLVNIPIKICLSELLTSAQKRRQWQQFSRNAFEKNSQLRSPPRKHNNKDGCCPQVTKKLGFYLWRSTLGAAGCLPATLVVDSVCR